MNAITISLTEAEFNSATEAGRARHRHHCERKGVSPTDRSYAQEEIGAVAEAAVAKLFGGIWNAEVGKTHYGSTDVVTLCGDPLEVKATEWATGRLLVYKNTPDDLPVLLCVVDRNRYVARLVGWIVAADAKKDEYWVSEFRIPCWAVPQRDLRRVEELPCLQSLLSRSRSASALETSPTVPPTTTPPASGRNDG